MQDMENFLLPDHDAREALEDSPDPRAWRPIHAMAQGNSSPLSVGSADSQKASDRFRNGVKRRGAISLERSTSNERSDYPPVWTPPTIFQQWDTTLGTPTYFDTSERLQNSPLPTPAVFGKRHPALFEPLADIKRWPREPNSHSELGQRPQSNSQSQRVAPVTEYGTGYVHSL